MAERDGGRLAYADLLRTASMLAVIVLHVAAGWLGAVPVGSADWHVLNVFDALTRWAVPVFVMLSGMFLLDPKKGVSWGDIFFRYLPRMAAALVFWGLAYQVLHFLLDGGTLTLASLGALLDSFLRGGLEDHLWYIPMAMGLYLVTPLLRAFVRGATRSDFHWFFLLTALFAFFLPTLLRLRPSDMLSFWVEQLRVQMVLGYVGYFVAGYYLKTYTLGWIAKTVAYLLGLGGAGLTIWGTYLLTQSAGAFDGVFYSYYSPGVAAMAVAVFVLFRCVLGGSDERARRQRVGRAAELSFGVYLVHLVFLTLIRRFLADQGFPAPPFTPVLAVPAVALAVFLPSFLAAWLLHKIPVVGRWLS